MLDPGTVAAIEAWGRQADEIVGAPTVWMRAQRCETATTR
ncbi:hypothetical protein BH18ACT4_BH18ACT4_15620 [soil metagenome]